MSEWFSYRLVNKGETSPGVGFMSWVWATGDKKAQRREAETFADHLEIAAIFRLRRSSDCELRKERQVV